MTLLHIPQNFETALEVEAVVSSVGAVPATIAIIQGRPCIGLSRAELESIAKNGSAVSHQGGCVNQWLWTISPNDLDELITSLKTSGNNLYRILANGVLRNGVTLWFILHRSAKCPAGTFPWSAHSGLMGPPPCQRPCCWQRWPGYGSL